MATKALRQYQAEGILPGRESESDEALLQKAGDVATTIFHPVSTCRMGADADPVADPRLRVKRLQGLRVVDSSIMQRNVSGNTASSVAMIPDKAADMIRRESKLNFYDSVSTTVTSFRTLRE